MKYVPSEIIIEAVRKWLGKTGLRLFRHYKGITGRVDPVFGMTKKRRLPHPVHFREGMQIRNFLRTLDECKAWTDHDYDNRWAAVIEAAIRKEQRNEN